ncbi:hypothetical protein DRJ54_08305 [Candidatus Acetothermia bacterium]|nr:MAG: hypothetical protein DRJ54_08305 [Candidatus Acetothermia bacterium]
MAKRKPLSKRKAGGRPQPARRDWPTFLSRVRLYALAFFLFSMPLFFLPGNTEYGYTKTIYTLVFVSGLLALWGAEALLRREWRLELTRLWPLLPALLAVALASLAGGTPACVVLQSAALILYFGLVYFLIVGAARGDREVVLLLSALLAAGVLAGLYGLLQYLGVMRGGPGEGLSARISTMGNRNYLGGFLAYLLFPCLILLCRPRRPWARGLALMGVGFTLAMALFVQQAGVRLGLLLGSLVLAFGLGLWPCSPIWRRDWPWWAATGATLLAPLLVILGPGPGAVALASLAIVGGGLYGIGRLLRRVRWAWVPVLLSALVALVLLLPPTTPIGAVREAWERNAGRVRAWDWWVGYEMWKDHPLTGIGLGGYKISFVPYKADFLATPQGAAYQFPILRAAQAHNEYVQVAAELGILGVLVLLGGIGFSVYLLVRRLSTQEDPDKRLELLLLGAGLATVLLHAGVSFPWHLPASSLAFVTGLALAFSLRYGPCGGFPVRLRGAGLKAAVLLAVSLGLAASVVGVRDLLGDRYLLAGQNALYLGEVPRARELLQRAVAMDFCPRHSLYWLGIAQLQSGDLRAAQATFRRCLSRYRPEPLYINLASVDAELGEYQEARTLLEELLATRPNRDTELGARYLLAVIDLKDGGDYVSAERRLKEILKLDPRFERALILLGDIARNTYRYDEAKNYYRQALGVIEREISRLERELSRPVTPEEYGGIRADLLRLSQEREKVQEILAQLP